VIRTTAFCFLAACALLLESCHQVPTQRGASVQTSSGIALEQKSPIDVVVAPVVNAAGTSKVPSAMLREAFQQGLVKRRYSPLALAYVDRKVTNSAYRPGTLQEQAVLRIAVERWDTSLWDVNNSVMVKAEARMLDAQNPGGADLWSGRVDRRFDFGAQRERFTSQESMLRYVCDEIAAEVLAALPARSPEPGFAPEG
jgi:hypothetical protein